jgi:hypothetical protein
VVFWTAADAARAAADELATDGGLSGAYRCLMQLLDDYRRVQRLDGTATAARLFDEPPPGAGDVRVDAALAALAEHLARHDGWKLPSGLRRRSAGQAVVVRLGRAVVACHGTGRVPACVPQAGSLPHGVGSGPSVNLLDRDQIMRLFDELSEELATRGTRAEVFLVGGAALALAYDGRRATRDVDAVFKPKEEVYAAAAAVAARHDLPDDWLNDGVKGFLPGEDPRSRPVYESGALRVDVASPQYLLAMKLLAARDQDIDDIVLLYRLCGFTSAAEGLDLVESVYPGRLIAPKVQFLLEEFFGPATS